MKPFLGIDLTVDKKNKEYNGKEFLVQEPSEALSSSLEASNEKLDETIKKARLPLPLRILELVCGFGTLSVIAGFFKSGASLSEALKNAPQLFWLVGVCAFIWLVLWLFGRKRMKTVVEADESKQLLSRLDGVAAAVFREMNVPDDAKAVDVLYFFYKEKNGEIKIVEKSLAAQCFNPEFRVFADEENLYLANLEGKYAFPLSSFVKTHTVKKNIRMLGWNKDEPHNKGIYKQYKLGVDDHGCVHCKSYNILEMKLQGEVYGIYIPCYELPVFEEILNGATKK